MLNLLAELVCQAGLHDLCRKLLLNERMAAFLSVMDPPRREPSLYHLEQNHHCPILNHGRFVDPGLIYFDFMLSLNFSLVKYLPFLSDFRVFILEEPIRLQYRLLL